MQRNERTLVEQLIRVTQTYIDKYSKFNPDVIKDKNKLQLLVDLFSAHGVDGYSRAVYLKGELEQMTGQPADDDAICHIYKQSCKDDGILYNSKELKKSLFTICANYLNIQSLEMCDFGYALIAHKLGKSVEKIKKTIQEKEAASKFLTGMLGDGTLSPDKYREATVNSWIDRLYKPTVVIAVPTGFKI